MNSGLFRPNGKREIAEGVLIAVLSSICSILIDRTVQYIEKHVVVEHVEVEEKPEE